MTITMTTTTHLLAPHALLPTGWASQVLLGWNAHGQLTQVQPDTTAPPPDVTVATGPVMPGMPNLHSHAFQRALAGLTEYRGHTADG